MNLFVDGVRPEWEDPNNEKGKIITLEYVISFKLLEFMVMVENAWRSLMLSLLGETLEYSEYINGIRFVDKTSLNVGKKVIFRFEIWLNKDFPKDKVNDYVKSIGKAIRIWDLNKKSCEYKLEGHNGPIMGLTILQDKRLVSCSADKTIKIWPIEDATSKK